MDITIYLPDALGRRAKHAKLPLSRMLRDAVTEELERLATLAETLSRTETIRLELVDDNGLGFIGRFRGTRIAEQDETTVYLTEDERVVAHNRENAAHAIMDRMEAQNELDCWLEGEAYIRAMSALGLKAIIDL